MTGELKAGFFVLAALASLIYMTTRLTQNQYSMAGTKSYYAQIHDATGLLQKTKVKMAGLDIGQLSKMELAGNQARIKVEIAGNMVLHKDAQIAVKAIGFLGDKYLELNPGTDAKPALEEDGYITEGVASGSIDQLTAKTTQLVDNLKEITDLLKDGLKGSGEGEDGSRLDRILDNMEKFSEGLAEMDKLGDFAERVTEIAANIREVTDKIRKGEGTVGKLLNDDETIERVNQTLSGVNKFLTKADKLQILVDARSGALTKVGGSRTTFNLLLQPSYDKYYLFGVNSRPQGITTTTRTTTTTNPGSAGASPVTVEESKLDEQGISFNAQFAKRFGDAMFRIGLFESTGGLGADYYFWNDRVKLTTEIYRFRKSNSPQLNVTAEMDIYKPFFVWTGGDFLLTRENRSYFIGGGIRFNDQDLKSLLTAAATGAGSSAR